MRLENPDVNSVLMIESGVGIPLAVVVGFAGKEIAALAIQLDSGSGCVAGGAVYLAFPE